MKPTLASVTASTRHAVLAILAVLLVAALDCTSGRELVLPVAAAQDGPV